MEDAGSIIYIIIMIIILLGGFFKNKKKKEQSSQQNSTPVSETTPYNSNNTDDWYYESKQHEVAPPPVPEKQKIIATKHPDLKNSIPSSYKTTGINSEESDIQNAENEKIAIELDSVEEARKAFIYSEIFQRKY